MSLLSLSAFCCLAVCFVTGNVIPIDLGHLIMCPMVDCAFPGPCTQFKQTFFTFQGRQCQGCPECPDKTLPKREADVVKGIPVFPSTCPNIRCARPLPCKVPYKTSTLTFANRTCTGCTYCPTGQEAKREVITEPGHLFMCPMPNCAMPGSCSEFKQTHYTFQGHQCPGCPECADKDLPKREVITEQPRVCPVTRCRNPGPCDQPYQMSYFDIFGMKCPMCPFCPTNKTRTERNVITEQGHLFMCPMVKCAMPGSCSEIKQTHFTFEGHQCPGCPECADKELSKRQVDVVNGFPVFPNTCPNILCARPLPCKLPYKTSSLTFANRTCSGCPYCPTGQETKRDIIDHTGIQLINICPIPMCASPGPCDHAYNTSYMTIKEKKCPMCPYCAKDKREVVSEPIDFICPRLPCPLVLNCKKSKPATYDFNGHACEGCSLCVEYDHILPQ